MHKIYLFCCLLFLTNVNLYGTYYTSIANGNWDTPTTWSPTGVPGSQDSVVINTYTVTQNVVSGITIRRLTINSGNLVTSYNLTVTDNLQMLGGTTYGIDTLFALSKADFTSANQKNIGNQIQLAVGGTWHQGTIYFCIDPTTGANNFGPAATTGGSITTAADTFRVSTNVLLQFKTNYLFAFIQDGTSIFLKTGNGLLENIGYGLGIQPRLHARVKMIDVIDDEGGNGGGGGGDDGSDDDDDDPDPEGGSIKGGDLFENPGGNGVGLNLGVSCNTNETAGDATPQKTIEGKIYISGGAKLILKSGIIFTNNEALSGNGKVRLDHATVSFDGLDNNIRQLIVVNKSVVKGSGSITSKKISSNASTIKGTLALVNDFLFLTNSFLVGSGTSVVDSSFELKGATGNSLNRNVTVNNKSIWSTPNVSFTSNGKITIETNAFLNVVYGTSPFKYNKGKGGVITNKGRINLSGTTGSLITTDPGNGIWNSTPGANARHCQTCMNDNPNGGGGGGGDPDGGGDVDTGGGGTTSSGCSTDPVPEFPQAGCFNLSNGNLKLTKGKTTFLSNSCINTFGTGTVDASGSSEVTFDAGSNGNVGMVASGNAIVNLNSCIISQDLIITGAVTININVPCSYRNLIHTGSGILGGNGNLTFTHNATVSGKIGGTRNINIGGNLNLTSGQIYNTGQLSVSGKATLNGSTLGSTTTSGTMIVSDSLLIAGISVINKRDVTSNGLTLWTAGDLYIDNGSSFIVSPLQKLLFYGVGRSIQSTTGINNLVINGSLIKNSNTLLQIGSNVINTGNIDITDGVLSLLGNSTHNGGQVKVQSGKTLNLYRGIGTITHAFNNLSSIIGSGLVNVNTDIVNFNAGSSFAPTLSFALAAGMLTSEVDLNFANISCSGGSWQGLHNISSTGLTNFIGGNIKNQGDFITEKLLWYGGVFGDGVVTGNINVADSTILSGNTKNLYKKIMNLNGLSEWSGGIFYFFNNATLNIASNKTFTISGSVNNVLFGADGSNNVINNYGTIHKNNTYDLQVTPKFNNYGTVNINDKKMRFIGNTNLEDLSITNIPSSSSCDFVNTTTNVKSGASISGSGTIITTSGAVNFNTGCILSPTLGMNNVNATINSSVDLTFSSIQNSGSWTGTHHINSTGNTTITNGYIYNQGDLNISGKLFWQGGNLGFGAATGTINVADSTLMSGNAKFLTNKTLNLNGHSVWTSTAITMDANAIINNALGKDFNIDGDFASFNSRSIIGIGIINNYGTINKNYTSESSFAPSFNNFGTLNINADKFRLFGNTNLEDLSVINIPSLSTCDFVNTTTNVKSGASISGSGTIITTSGAVNFISGCSISPNLMMNNVNATINSSINLTFSTILTSGTWLGTFDINSIGNTTVSGGIIKNLGDFNMFGKLNWQGGAFGDGMVSGNINVTDSTLMSGNQKSIKNKTLNLNGHTKWTSTDITMETGAIINNAIGKNFNMEGVFVSFNGRNINGNATTVFNNYGSMIKSYSSPSTYATVINNVGTFDNQSSTSTFGENFTNSGQIKGNGAITFTKTFTNSGIVSPGASPGILTFNKFSNAGSTLQIEVAGIGAAGTLLGRDSIKVTGAPGTLGGTLRVDILGGITIDSAQQFEIASLPSSYGVFDNLITTGLTNDSMSWKIIYNPTTVAIKFCPMWYPDTDMDGYGDFDNPSKFCDCITQPLGFVRSYSDCNDGDGDEFPGQIWYTDQDGDHHGTITPSADCGRPIYGFIAEELTGGTMDCDDNDPDVYPGQTWYIDHDEDGWGEYPGIVDCYRPTDGNVIGQLLGLGDCEDNSPSLYPNSSINIVTSAQEGIWDTISTWNCGIPQTEAQSITISDLVTLTSSKSILSPINLESTGHLIINNGKVLTIGTSLNHRDLIMNSTSQLTLLPGATLIVYGAIITQPGGIIENAGDIFIKK